MALKRQTVSRPAPKQFNFALPNRPLPRQQQNLPAKQNFQNNQFPGTQNGATEKEVKAYIKNQPCRKGFRFSGGTTPVDFQLSISGTANFIFGIAWDSTSFGTFSLMINNVQVIETVDTGFFEFGKTVQDYFAINYPLSGQDDIKITITGDAPYVNKSLIVYYKRR